MILRRRVPVSVVVALALLAIVDQARLITIGGSTLSALLTLTIAAVFVVLLPMVPLARADVDALLPRQRRSNSVEPFHVIRWQTVPLPLTLLLLMGVGGALLNPTTFAWQNVAVYLGFVLAIPLTAYLSSAGTSVTFLRIAGWIALAASTLFIVTTLAGVEFYGERAFAAVALVYLAVLVPNRSANLLVRVAPYVVTAAIVLSLSRAAAAVALVMLVFLAVRGRRGRRLARAIFLLAMLVTVAVVVVWSYPPFRERFFGGDNAIQLGGGLTFNTSGRDRIWATVTESWVVSPWFGHGVGSAQELITNRLGTIAHPHNEYLRLLHDFGIFGLVLFVLAMIALLWATGRRAWVYDAPEHWSAFLALFGILILGWTDNPLVYVFVVVPAGVLLGLSMASPPPPKRQITRARQVREASRARPAPLESLRTRS